MKSLHKCLILFCLAAAFLSLKSVPTNWIIEKHNSFSLFYTSSDKDGKEVYAMLVENGVASVKTFFKSNFKDQFDVYVHPNRQSLDSTWQMEWGMPEFKSECWMVASGVSNRLDMVSPRVWDQEACEHDFSEKKKTQKLITHEIFHVYHGQHNRSPDFSNIEGIDWFVEGLATYASGQCDSLRISEVKKAIKNNTTPTGLDAFSTDKLRYGLCGTVTKYIDYKYGRLKMIELLPFTKRTEILSALNTTETELISEWKKYMIKL